MRLLRKIVIVAALACAIAAIVLFVLSVSIICIAAAIAASAALLFILPKERRRPGYQPGNDRYPSTPIARYPPTDPGAAGAAMAVRERRKSVEVEEERPLLIAR